MSDIPISPLIRDALDTTHSVVVEACAGSGKTWLLVSRIIRILIAGGDPSEILAITYTRKAAQEMQARLNDWLRELATAPEESVRAFLHERALSDAEITLALPRVRGLFELALTSRPALTVNTFHGWFLDLLQRAPLNSGAAGNVALLEQTSPLIEEAWQALAEQLLDAPDSPIAHALNNLFRDYGLTSTRKVLQCFINKRAEWWRYTHDQAPDQRVAYALDQLQEELGAAFDEPILEPLFADDLLIASLEKFALLLEANGTASDIKYAATIRTGMTKPDLTTRFDKICRAFFKQDGEPYARATSKARAERLKAEAEAQYTKLNERITARLAQAKTALIEQNVLRFNRDALVCGEALLEHYQQLKAARGVLDFTDIEYRTHTLLTSEDHAAYMQYKLDARYRHILLDEFQDTNPLQWQILKSWFDAAVSAERTPQVFVVGDPKQSIYRFRGADARLYDLAKRDLGQDFGAQHLQQDLSRRNAQPILDVVNRLFSVEPAFTSFQAHLAHQTTLPGQVWLLPLETQAEAAEAVQTGLRNPLTTPLQEAAESAHQREAERIASSIQHIVGQWAITDKGTRRAAEYRDIMLLTRARTHLRVYEDALKRAGIPFLTSRRGGLLETLEARDLSALLAFLVLPYADLKLAHVLRSPLFGVSDEDLLALSQSGEGPWWQRLNSLVAAGKASAALARAHALLDHWRHASDQLPVHDLLDRIYHQGDVLARYRRAAPPAMADSVAANLHGYLELSLTLEGGRYPSLPKFIDELAVLRSSRDEEAPDEGQVADAENAVHIYTVHGAKGLERPIVWLVDAHRVTPPMDAYSALVDWAPGESAPAHFSLTSTLDQRGQARAPHFEREAGLSQREELNLLYVAMTRAQQYLIVSGSTSGKNSSRPSWYARIASVVEASNDLTPPDRAPLSTQPATAAALPAANETAPTLPDTGPACGQRTQIIDTPAMRHGTLLHRLLEQLAPPAPAKDKLQLQQEWAISDDSFDALWREAHDILDAAPLARFFDPAQYCRAWNELPFLTANGDFLRIDRLVEFENEIWVLDYKSTENATEATLQAAAQPHRAQLQTYLSAMQSLFTGKQIKGGLIFKGGLLFEIPGPK